MATSCPPPPRMLPTESHERGSCEGEKREGGLHLSGRCSARFYRRQPPPRAPTSSPAAFLSSWTSANCHSPDPALTHKTLTSAKPIQGAPVCPAHVDLAGSETPNLRRKRKEICFLSSTQSWWPTLSNCIRDKSNLPFQGQHYSTPRPSNIHPRNRLSRSPEQPSFQSSETSSPGGRGPDFLPWPGVDQEPGLSSAVGRKCQAALALEFPDKSA